MQANLPGKNVVTDTFKAGFAAIDITPQPGGIMQGCMRRNAIAETVDHPLYARAAVFDGGLGQAAIIQLDLLSIRWTQTNAFRSAIEKLYGFPGANIMVAATHNHRGPPVANLADIPRDEEYLQVLTEKVVRLFGAAMQKMQPAKVGMESVLEWEVVSNRRVVKRNGLVGSPGVPPLYIDGPIDPEVAVLGVQDGQGRLMGMLVNHAMHPNAAGAGIGAGVPGWLELALRKTAGCPITIFLNGAAGNLQIHSVRQRLVESSETELAEKLARDVRAALQTMRFEEPVPIRMCRRTVDLPFRKATPAEIGGTAPGAVRAGEPGMYDRVIPGLLELIKKRGVNKAEVQALRIGQRVYVAIPGELFVELGLAIKEQCFPAHVVVVGYANGMVGYLPTRAAFLRGGYETTFTSSSRLDPSAGYILVDTAVALARELTG